MMGRHMIIQGKIPGSLIPTPRKKVSLLDVAVLAVLMCAIAGFFVLEVMSISMTMSL